MRVFHGRSLSAGGEFIVRPQDLHTTTGPSSRGCSRSGPHRRDDIFIVRLPRTQRRTPDQRPNWNPGICATAADFVTRAVHSVRASPGGSGDAHRLLLATPNRYAPGSRPPAQLQGPEPPPVRVRPPGRDDWLSATAARGRLFHGRLAAARNVRVEWAVSVPNLLRPDNCREAATSPLHRGFDPWNGS